MGLGSKKNNFETIAVVLANASVLTLPSNVPECGGKDGQPIFMDYLGTVLMCTMYLVAWEKGSTWFLSHQAVFSNC